MEIDGIICQVGHTKEYVKIAYETEENLSNQIVDVEIESHLQIKH
ncbi:miaB-like tRNA modifying enzyme [Dorea sp. CAG:317]|nr:miaB-like tRNA modifying enzyme [Dorea sp. CAG:317]